MNEKLILSLAIPAYNGAETIAKTLDSFIGQINGIQDSANEIEIVVVDDCSKDNTSEIVKLLNGLFTFRLAVGTLRCAVREAVCKG